MTTTAKIAPLGYLSDQETKVDLLNNEAIARTIVRLIDETTDSAVTIGVHGDWGAGKSSVLEMVEAAFPDGGEVLCLKFSGWHDRGRGARPLQESPRDRPGERTRNRAELHAIVPRKAAA